MEFVSRKVNNLPPYLFSKIQEKKEALQAKGMDVIDLGIGAPDLPTPTFIIDKLIREMKIPANHRYSSYSGCREFREAVVHFYKQRYGVTLHPDEEVLTLIGSKEGIANLVQTVINPGDYVLVPDPGYPVYRTAVHLANGITVDLPLDAENGYVPIYSKLTAEQKEKAKLMFLNYPSNPTTATIQINTLLEAVTFAKENNMLVVNDMAYDLVTFADYESPSILQVPHAKDRAIEFGSLSKSFNMTGWRIGYVVGNKDVIQALATLKSNIDTSQFLPIQKAAADALKSDFSHVKQHAAIFERRMEKLYQALHELGIRVDKPRGTIFLWAKVPNSYTSIAFTDKLLEEAGIVVTPGNAFGPSGEGYIRISLSVSEDRLDEVIRRLHLLDLKGEQAT